MNFAGLPAEVLTQRTPLSQTNLSMASSLRNRMGKLTPNGSPEARMTSISRLQSSVSPEEVSITPSPPARDTASANCDRAIHPMGA